MDLKNDTVIRPVSDRSLDVTPYDTYRLLLNTLGGESWQRDGSAAYYAVEVPSSDVGGSEQLWREDRIHALLDEHEKGVLFVSGCVANQGRFYPRFDAVVLLSAPADVILERVATRETNNFGKSEAERDRILHDFATFEPLLRGCDGGDRHACTTRRSGGRARADRGRRRQSGRRGPLSHSSSSSAASRARGRARPQPLMRRLPTRPRSARRPASSLPPRRSSWRGRGRRRSTPPTR